MADEYKSLMYPSKLKSVLENWLSECLTNYADVYDDLTQDEQELFDYIEGLLNEELDE